MKNSIVSALFFAVDATVVKYGLCLLRNAWGKPPPVPHFLPFLAGLLGSFGLLIERQSRRVELLYYVLPQVLKPECNFVYLLSVHLLLTDFDLQVN